MSARTGEHPGARGWRVPRVTRHAVDGSAGRLHLVRDPEPVPDERHEEGSGAAPEPVRVDGLRLALVSDTYLPQVNGVTRTLDRLAREVAARGGAVEVFTAHDPRAADAEAALAERASRVAPGGREGGPRIHRHGSVPFWGYPELRLAAPGGRQLAGELARFGATLVHAATPFGMGLAARRASQLTGVPLVTSYHTHFTAYAHFYQLGLLHDVGWRFLRWFHNSGRRTYCPTEAVAAEVRAHGFANTAVWGRGVDTRTFAPAWRTPSLRASIGLREHELVVLYVGRVAREKGIDDAIDAMRLLRALPDAPPCRLLVVGDGPYLARCRERAGSNVTFAGHHAGAQLSRLYATADLFVLPSTTETFGNVTLEAMASGLPVIAAESAVTRELLTPGAGSFHPPGDAKALASHIARWGRDPALRRAAGRKGRLAAMDRSWERVFDRLFGDYLVHASKGTTPRSAV